MDSWDVSTENMLKTLEGHVKLVATAVEDDNVGLRP
jgi:hypothetical protein